MKTIKKTLYYKEYESPICYGYKPEHRVKSYIEIKAMFDFKCGLRFAVSIPNVSYCHRNPLKALFDVLEHESIGMAKYQRLKDDVRNSQLMNKIKI